MSDDGLLLLPSEEVLPLPIDPRLLQLKQMVLDSVVSANSKRNYAQALDGLFLFRGWPAAHASSPDGVEGDHGRAGSLRR